MFCQYCGKPIDVTATFCTSCGRQKVGGAPVVIPRSPSERMASHLRILSVLWLIYSAFRILMGTWTLVFSHYMLPMMSGFFNEGEAQTFFDSLMNMLRVAYEFSFVYSLLTGIAGLIAAWALYQRQPWGRICAIVISIASIISIPFGTALGVYTLVVLLASDGEKTYRSLAVQT